jgi:hypothetical protein
MRLQQRPTCCHFVEIYAISPPLLDNALWINAPFASLLQHRQKTPRERVGGIDPLTDFPAQA